MPSSRYYSKGREQQLQLNIGSSTILVKTILMENKMENEWARKREATWKGTEERTTSLKLRTRKRSVTKLADNPKNSVSENKGVEKNELWAEMSASGAHRDWRGGGEISPGSYQLQWKDSNNWLTESKMPTPMTHQKCSEIPKCDPPNPSNQKSNLFLGWSRSTITNSNNTLEPLGQHCTEQRQLSHHSNWLRSKKIEKEKKRES